MDNTRSPERRHSGRVHATGTAVVHGPFAAHGRLVDLSIGGVSLLLDDLVALPVVGAYVRLDVRLDGIGRWLHLTGSVVRVAPQGTGAALVIDLLVVPADFEDLVQDELLSALECEHLPPILLVDGARGRRELVADAFRAMGCHVIEVGSPLEAIEKLDQSRLHFWAVVIADTRLAAQGQQLRRFLREAYPGVRLVNVRPRGRGEPGQLGVAA